MKNKHTNKITKALILTTAMATMTTGLSGCVGSNAVTAALMGFNLKAVDNRYGRGGLNILLSPVYAITIAADYIVFNSIGFWTGKNPLNGKPHIFDTKVETYLEVNDDLDPSLTDAPVKPITKVTTNFKEVRTAQVSEVDENTLDFNITYTDGSVVTLRGKKEGERIDFYLEDEFVAQTSMAELQAYAAK